MKARLPGLGLLRSRLGVPVVAGAAISADAPRRGFTPNQKEYDLDAQAAAFIRPGFNVSIVSDQLTTAGQISVLHRDGVFTPGPVTQATKALGASHTTTLGESCDLCLGTQGEFSVSRAHAH